MHPINEIKHKLEKYSELTVVTDKYSITVKNESLNGFDVSFYDDKFEYTVCFDGWHEHFEKNDYVNAINCFAFGLSDKCRIKVLSRGGVDYKWVVQSYENGKWINDSVTGLLWYKFWHKIEIRFLQNAIIKT